MSGRIDPTVYVIDPSHDRKILRGAEADCGKEGLMTGLPIVLVKCPHTVGLCYLDASVPDAVPMLAQLPCPCNERSEIIAHLTIAEEPSPTSGVAALAAAGISVADAARAIEDLQARRASLIGRTQR